jgi:hypothetical protein
MFHYPDTIRCDGCGAELLLAPVIQGERSYCCEDCAAGRPCPCAERQDRDDERRARPGGSSIETTFSADSA